MGAREGGFQTEDMLCGPKVLRHSSSLMSENTVIMAKEQDTEPNNVVLGQMGKDILYYAKDVIVGSY